MIRIHPDNGGDKLLYGAKVLGSYVGSEESIANRLLKKPAELKKEADAITTVGSLQIQYLLAPDSILTASLLERQPNKDDHNDRGESHNTAASPRSDLAWTTAGSGHVSVSRTAGDSLVGMLTRQYGWPLVGLRPQVRDAQDRQRLVSCRPDPSTRPPEEPCGTLVT